MTSCRSMGASRCAPTPESRATWCRRTRARIADGATVGGEVDRARDRFALGSPRRHRARVPLGRGDGVELRARRDPACSCRRARRGDRRRRAHRGRAGDRARVRARDRGADPRRPADGLAPRPAARARDPARARSVLRRRLRGGRALPRAPDPAAAEEPLARLPRWAGGSCGCSRSCRVLGAFVAFAAVVYGLGCIAVAVYRSRRATPDSDVLAPTPVS